MCEVPDKSEASHMHLSYKKDVLEDVFFYKVSNQCYFITK